MPRIRYAELQDASDRNRASFMRYENECRGFVKRFREGLVLYLGCPEDKVEWLRFKDKSEEELKATGIREVTLGGQMILHRDAFYRVGLRILFDLEHADLSFRVKKLDEYFIVKLGKKEHRVHEAKQEELVGQLIEQVFNIAKEYYETMFENFIRGKPSTLGFKTGR